MQVGPSCAPAGACCALAEVDDDKQTSPSSIREDCAPLSESVRLQGRWWTAHRLELLSKAPTSHRPLLALPGRESKTSSWLSCVRKGRVALDQTCRSSHGHATAPWAHRLSQYRVPPYLTTSFDLEIRLDKARQCPPKQHRACQNGTPCPLAAGRYKMQGLMQRTPLVVNNILDYAAKFHGEPVAGLGSARSLLDKAAGELLFLPANCCGARHTLTQNHQFNTPSLFAAA